MALRLAVLLAAAALSLGCPFLEELDKSSAEMDKLLADRRAQAGCGEEQAGRGRGEGQAGGGTPASRREGQGRRGRRLGEGAAADVVGERHDADARRAGPGPRALPASRGATSSSCASTTAPCARASRASSGGRSSERAHAAVDDERVPRDEGGGVAREEDDGALDVVLAAARPSGTRAWKRRSVSSSTRQVAHHVGEERARARCRSRGCRSGASFTAMSFVSVRTAPLLAL